MAIGYYGIHSAEAPRWANVSLPEHAAIWQAIRDRDAEAAERTMRRHMCNSSARVQNGPFNSAVVSACPRLGAGKQFSSPTRQPDGVP